MDQLSTKQRILEEALTLFAEKGYDAVSVAEIASAVGIKAPSLYKHYISKQDILEAILNEMADRYAKQSASMQMDGMEAQQDASMFMKGNEDQLIQTGKGLFLYFLHDEYTCKFRRMLTIEQYHSPELAALYAKQYVDDALSYQGMLFGLFVQTGYMIQEDPQIMALQFYAPLFLLLTLCDCHPEKEAEAIEILEKHIRQFNRLYRNKEDL